MRLWYLSSSVNSFLNMHAQLSSGAKCLIFSCSLRLLPYFMCVNSEGSGKTGQMCIVFSTNRTVLRFQLILA